MRRLGPVFCPVLLLLCSIAAQPAAAATTLGSTCSPVDFPVASLVQAEVQFGGPSYTMPGDGVLTSFSTLGPNADGNHIKLKVFRRTADMAKFLVVGESELRPVVPGPNQYDTRVSVKQDDLLGMGGGSYSLRCDAGFVITDTTVHFPGDPAPGTTPSGTYQTGFLADISAQLEPDLDGDGYGDESQDKCPTDKSTQGTCPPAASVDIVAPTLSGASLANGTFRVDRQGVAARKRSPSGTTIRFSLSEASNVTVTVERAAKGRLRKGTCKTRARRGKRCKIFKPAGSFSIAGVAGANQKPFSGKIGSKALKPGSYRATLIATDAAGNRSKNATLAFRIVR